MHNASSMSSGKHLDRSLARAIAWNAAAKWTAQVFSWASTIIVARLLTPYDYGLMGMAGFYLCLATLVSDSGIEQSIISLRDLTSERIAQLNTFALIVGAGLAVLSCLLAYPIARFFVAPPVRTIIMIAGTAYVITGFQTVPKALLKKELRFKLLASIETARMVCQIAVTIVLAWLGFRYWSLLYGTIANWALGTVLVLYWKRHEFSIPHFSELKREIKYAMQVLLSQITWYAYDNADFGIAGRVLGAVPLGNYTVAWNIASAPLGRVTNLITGVTPAFFSAVQSDSAALRRYLLTLTEMMSLATVPASVGIGLTAEYIVPVVFGPKWYGVIGPLRWLGIFFAVRSITTILPNLLTAIGDAGFVMWNMILSVVVMPIAFLVGSHWGTSGIAAAWVFVFPPLAVPLYWRVFRKTEMVVKEYLQAILPAVSASAVMSVVVLFARSVWVLNSRSVVGLSSLVIAGALSYAGALVVFHYERIVRLIRAVKRMRSSGAEGKEAAVVGPSE